MNIEIIIKKIRRNLSDFGVRTTVEKCFRYLFKTFYLKNTYRIYRRDLRGEQFQEPCLDEVVLRVVENKDAQALRQIEDMEEWLQGRLQGIISRGFCIAAFDGPRVVGFNAVALQEVFVPLLNLKKRLQPHQAWSKQISVLKAYRRQGLATALNYRVFAELQRRGIRMFYSGTMVSNIPSLRAHEKAGFRFIADVTYLKVLHLERRIWSRTRKAGQ